MSIPTLLLKKSNLWLLLLILVACTPATQESIAPQATIAVERPTTTPTTDEMWVRVYNQTRRDYGSIGISFPEQWEDFGPLAGGTSSDFRLVSQAHSDVIVELAQTDEIIILELAEDEKKTLLPGGYYTYVLARPSGILEVQLVEGQAELPQQPVMETVYMIVSGETAACNDGTSRSCLLVKYNRDDEWELFAKPIERFHYEPGYEYELIVYKYTSTATLPDGHIGTYIRYRAVEFLEQTGVTPETAQTLNGTTWHLLSYNSNDGLPRTDITLEFNEDMLGGQAGCNEYWALYEVTKPDSADAITIDSISSTELGCPGEVLQQEGDYLSILSSATHYYQGEHDLTIWGDAGLLTFLTPEMMPVATATIIDTPTDNPEGITILEPGPLSQVGWLVTVAGVADFPFEGTLAVQIMAYTDEGTAVVGTGFAAMEGEFGERSSFYGEVELTQPIESTPGRIIVSSISPLHGQPHHLASVPVTLLPWGERVDIKPATSQPEAITIHTPSLGDEISGSTIHITGSAAPTFEQNLVIEILNESGTIVGSGFTTIAAGVGESGFFEANVAYDVPSQTTGAVCVQDVNALDGNMNHRTCITVQLLP